MEKLSKALAAAIVLAALVFGSLAPVSSSAFAAQHGPQFSTASFCGRYVSSYTAIYQPTAGLPKDLTTPLSALEAAVITADGRGNIIDGEFTQNAPANPPQACTITANKTYTVGTSPLGESGYLSFNPTYTCTGYDPTSCTTGTCTILGSSYGGGTIQSACYLSDPTGATVVCSELANGFTNNSFSARATTWQRISNYGCPNRPGFPF